MRRLADPIRSRTRPRSVTGSAPGLAMRPVLSAVLAGTLLFAASLLAACGGGYGDAGGPGEGTTGRADGEGGTEAKEEIELAVPMAHLQRHSAKLGYAVEGENGRLAAFYLTETEEALEELRGVESYEGWPIARQVEVIMDPTLPPLRQALEGGDWTAARDGYAALIEACNRCHTATEHEFLVIEPARGPAPYNQRFAADGGGAGTAGTGE